MFTIRPSNNRGVLIGPITEEIEALLQARYVWYDAEDLTNEALFYADGAMYLGVVYDVAEYLTSEGYPCVVELPEIPPSEHGWKFEWEYRPRQEPAVEALFMQRFAIGQAPVGFGKTVVLSALTAKIGHRTAIIVQADEPLQQAYHTLLRSTNIKPGRVSGDHRVLKEVTVFMIQTLNNELQDNPEGEIAKWYRSSKVVLVDECHHAGAFTYMQVIDAVDDPWYVIGVSATPEDREDGKQDFVNAFFGKPAFEVTFGQQIEDGTACPITVFVEYIPAKDYGLSKARGKADWQRRQAYTKVYDDYVINNHDRSQRAVDFAREMIEDGFSVALIVKQVDHAENIKKMMPEITIVTSKTKNREEVIFKLKRHEIMSVVTTLFDEAVDVPSLGAVGLLAGGKSKIKLKQRLRSTRVFDGETVNGIFKKERGFVWYPYDQCDFLRTHSNKNLAVLRKLVDEHPDNELVILK